MSVIKSVNITNLLIKFVSGSNNFLPRRGSSGTNAPNYKKKLLLYEISSSIGSFIIILDKKTRKNQHLKTAKLIQSLPSCS